MSNGFGNYVLQLLKPRSKPQEAPTLWEMLFKPKFISPVPDQPIAQPTATSTPTPMSIPTQAPTPTAVPTQAPTPMATPTPPTPIPTPTPTQRTTEHVAKVAGAENVKQKILKAFPRKEGFNPVNIASIESSLQADKVGNLGERGLFQILPSTFEGEKKNFPKSMQYLTFDDMFNEDDNIRVARWLFDRYGYSPWTGSAPQLGLI